jgi:hypothetical protein
MKKIIDKIYEGLIAWAEIIHQYRQHNYHRDYY